MTQSSGRSTRAIADLSGTLAICVASAALIGAATLPCTAHAGEIPTFAAEAAWQRPGALANPRDRQRAGCDHQRQRQQH
jgi:hypothetical protein